MNLRTIQFAAYGAAALLAGVVLYQVIKKGKDAASAIGDTLQAVNPFNADNVVASTVNAGLQKLGVIAPDDSLGTALAGIFSSDAKAADAAVRAPVILKKAPTISSTTQAAADDLALGGQGGSQGAAAVLGQAYETSSDEGLRKMYDTIGGGGAGA